MAEYAEIVFAGTNGGATHEHRRLRRRRRIQRAAQGARDGAGRRHRRARGIRAARARRRGLPDRTQVGVRSEARPAAEAALPRRQRRRVGAWNLQGPGDHAPRPVPVPRGLPDRGVRDPVPARVRLHPRRVRAGVRGASRLARGDAEGRSPRRSDDRRPPRRGCLHLRRGDGAPRVARGEARPAADEAAVPRDRRPVRGADRSEQRRVDHDRHPGHRDGRRGVREARRRELGRDACVLALGQRRQPRELRAPARDLDARAHLRHRRRRPRRARAEGGDPGRLLHVGADCRRGRHEDGLHLARRCGIVDRLRGRDRHRRPLLHGAARHPRLPVLRARVVREVHAVPRRDEAG